MLYVESTVIATKILISLFIFIIGLFRTHFFFSTLLVSKEFEDIGNSLNIKMSSIRMFSYSE